MKITKMPKRLAEPLAEVQQLSKRVFEAPDEELPDILDGIAEWCWPRGDLHFWAPVLNRFDTILEETCRDYDLSKLQINEFTPLRKRLIVSILNFSRMLIENSTSRKLYNSYEHLNSLLFARDTDVLEATLRLFLRFAQQHNGQHPRAELQPSQERLATIAVTWAPRDHSIDSVEFAKDEAKLRPDVMQVRFQFYRRRNDDEFASRPGWAQEGSSEDVDHAVTPVRPRPRDRSATGNVQSTTNTPTAPQITSPEEGLTTIDLGSVGTLDKDPMDILADAVETNDIPPSDHFELFQKIRLAKAIPHPAQRRQLLVCRLLAIACYAQITSESTASTQLFLYEPDIVQRTAALVKPEHQLPRSIVASALYALDGLGRYRSKLNEVLSSLSASVNHGVLMQVLHFISDELASGHPTLDDQQLIDAFYGLVSFITSTNFGSGLVTSAGLVRSMVELLDKAKPETYIVQRSMTRAVGLLDSVLYAHSPAFNLFCQAQGLDVFVRRIEEQVNEDVERVRNEMQRDGDAATTEETPYGRLTFGRAHLLRGFLQSISHMMISTGTAEGLRNLIDTSLLSSIKTVMENRDVFGPQNLALCINIMATFVHNEPTSLGVIQEKKLPETFLALVKEKIEPHFDVINAIPNAVGALCLNQAGLDMFTSELIVPHLLSLLTSERHVKVLSDQDNVTIFGGAIDELIRHQPTMKQAVIDGTINVLRSIQEADQSFVAPDADEVSSYTVAKATAESKQLTNLDVQTHAFALADVIADDADVKRIEQVKDANIVAQYIDITCRFLEVFFQSANHCKDFLRAGGLTKLLEVYNFDSLSYNFASSTAADSFVHLLQYMSDVSPMMIVQSLLHEVKKSIDETKGLWSETGSESQLLQILYPVTDEEVATCNLQFRQLIRLNARLQLLADVTPAFTYSNSSGSKVSISFLQILNASLPMGNRYVDAASISDLAHFQRCWLWQCILFRASAPSSVSQRVQEETSKDVAAQEDGASSSAVPADAGGALAQARGKMDDAPQRSLSRSDPVMKNAVAMRYILSSAKGALSSFFNETSRLISSRRAHDPTYKRLASLTAEQIGKNLRESLKWKPHENATLSCAYATDATSHAFKLLFDERSNHSGYFQVSILAPFLRADGLSELVANCNHFLSELQVHFDSDGRPHKSSDLDSAVRLGHACNGLRTCLELFQKLVSSKSILDSPNLSLVVSKEGVSRSSPDYFEPHEALISIRRTILLVVDELWNKAWLEHLPYGINRTLLQTLLFILEGEGETKPAKKESHASGLVGSGSSSNVQSGLPAALAGLSGAFTRSRPSAVQPDESRITQLMDMGFPRRAARNALVRCSNNLSAAAEYLLMHPETMMMSDDAEEASSNSNQASTAADQQPAQAQQDDQQQQAEQQQEDAAANGGESSTVDAQQASAATAESTEEHGADEQSGGDVNMEEHRAPEAQDTSVAADEIKKSEDKEDGKEASASSSDEDARIQAEHEQLNESRSRIMSTLVPRALSLADTYEALVFLVKTAVHLASASFTKSETLIALFDEIPEKAPARFGASEKAISVRLHLLALIFNDTTVTIKLSPEKAKHFMDALMPLTEGGENGSVASWLASLLLVIAAVVRAEYEIENVTIEDKGAEDKTGSVRVGAPSLFDKEVNGIFAFCLGLLDQIDALQTDDILALYRVLVILTRRAEIATLFAQKEGLAKVLRPFASPDVNKIAVCRPYAAMITRQVVESHPSTLRPVMTQEIVNWFRLQRTKTIDTTALSRGLSHAMMRDPDLFLDILTKDLKIKMIDYSVSKAQGYILPLSESTSESDSSVQGSKQEKEAQTGPFSAPTLDREVDDSMEVVPASPTKQPVTDGADEKGKTTSKGEVSASPDGAMHFLLGELIRHSRELQVRKPSSEASQPNAQNMDLDNAEHQANETKAKDGRYFYCGFLLQMLTELLSSYLPCKVSFLNFAKKRAMSGAVSGGLFAASSNKRDQTPSKARNSSTVLGLFLVELIPLGFISSRDYEAMRRSMSISNWAMSVIVALSADVSIPPSNDFNASKEIHVEVVQARKAILDALSKCIKDATLVGTQSNLQRSRESVEARYGRLYSLTDLTYRLLKARPNASSNAQPYNSSRAWSESSIHLAKTMLEKNFVTALTSALADVDLNLPMVKPLLERILKPLEYLTKIASKMNRAEGKRDKKRNALQDESGRGILSSDESVDEDEMDEEDDEDEAEDDHHHHHHEDGREETPDFYRNSSLGMHTGDMEAYHEEDEDDEDEDEDMDDDMPPPIGFEDEETDDSDDDDDDDSEEHIVEVMDEDDEDDSDSDSEDDSDGSIDEEDLEGVEGSWVDEDEEEEIDFDDEDEDEDDEVLDFVIEGDPEHAHELFEQAGQIFHPHDAEGGADLMPPPALLADVDEDEDDDGDEMDEDSDGSVLEEVFEDGLQPLGLLDPIDTLNPAPVDRFGANWSWTNNQHGQSSRSGASRASTAPAADAVISPFAFMRQRPVQPRHSRSRRLLDWESDPLADGVPSGVSRYIATSGPFAAGISATGGAGVNGGSADVASHPLLRQDAAAEDGGPANLAPRLQRSNANRRDFGNRQGSEGQQDWARSLDELMSGGAIQFLETLLRTGAGQHAEPIRISLTGGVPQMAIGGQNVMRAPFGQHPSRAAGEADESGTAADANARQPEKTLDVVNAVQDFTPLPTSTRWIDSARIIHGPLLAERSTALRSYLVNALRPSYFVEAENLKRKKAEVEEEKRKSSAELEKSKREKERIEQELKEARAQYEEARRQQNEAEQQASSSTAVAPGAQASETQPNSGEQAAHAGGESDLDGDTDMTEGATGSEAQRANLELNSLQQGLDELVPSSAAEQAGSQPNQNSSSEEATQPTEQSGAPSQAEPRERVTTILNGTEIDITDSGIDPTFLEALPEDMREEVLNQHFRERRAAAAATSVAGANLEAINIAPEFLDALPPELRAEVIQQEAIENHRRRVDEARRQSRLTRREGGNGAGGNEGSNDNNNTDDQVDLDPASFLATLNSDLRSAVLMDQDQAFLDTLPSNIVAELDDARRVHQRRHVDMRRLHRRFDATGMPIAAGDESRNRGENSASGTTATGGASSGANGQPGAQSAADQAPLTRDAIQLVDKTGITALVRLMFFPQMDAQQSGLRNVLANLSGNSKTRNDLLNLLLVMLADGTSADVHAVDKTYTSMSDRVHRQTQTPTRPTVNRNQSTPNALGPASPAIASMRNAGDAATVQSIAAPISRTGDEAPFLIASRSIEMLSYLVSTNEQAAHYFLRDDPHNHALTRWLKRNAQVSASSKGKEKVATSNAPINILLVLLGKQSILANAQLVDSLIALLHLVTRHLPTIAANIEKQKKKEEEEALARSSAEEKAKGEVDKPASAEAQPAADASATNVSDNVSAVRSTQANAAASPSSLPLAMPQIAADRMVALVKPLSTGISSKGFQNTLAVASNLSSLDGAREVITSALQEEAKLAGQSLLKELDDLLESLPPAPAQSAEDDQAAHNEHGEGQMSSDSAQEHGAEGSHLHDTSISQPTNPIKINSPALTELASPSSSQTVILRSLRALEWIMTRPKPASAQAASGSGSSSNANTAHRHQHYPHVNQQDNGRFLGATTVRLW